MLPWKSPDAHFANITLEQYMDVLAKHNYVEKVISYTATTFS